MNRILYAEAVYGQEEKYAVMQSLDNPWLAAGKSVEKFEHAIASLFGKRYGLATNSGSSANLLGLTSLGIELGSEVITPACTFATTVAPIVQCGLTPVFVDVNERYVIDENLVEAAITDKTKAIFVPQLIGNTAAMWTLREIANKYNLFLIDDSCDTLSPKAFGEPMARFADITTTSFYGSHIITSMGSGGMLMTDSLEIAEKARSLMNWGRVGSDNEDFNERFDFELDNIPYDAKFIYREIGFNMKMTEAQAAFGLAQLKRLEEFTEKRLKAHAKLTAYFSKYKDWFVLPSNPDNYTSIKLAFALTIKPEAPFTRYSFLQWLDSHGIQVRVLFSGNITRHPAYKNRNIRIASELTNSDNIMANGLLVGCHQGLTDEDIDRMIEVSEEFLCHQ